MSRLCEKSNMKKVHRYVLAGIVFIAALPLLSCTTLGNPSLPKPHSSNDTLLIVPIGRAEGSVTGSYGNLRLSYAPLPAADSESGTEEFFVASPVSESKRLDATYPNFGTVRYLRPGAYRIEAVRFISKKHPHFGKRHDIQNIEFVVKPNTITVLPYRFFIRYTKPIAVYESGELIKFIIDTDVVDIQKLNEEEIAHLWEEVDSYNNIELWQGR
jgi:hypothetical protein